MLPPDYLLNALDDITVLYSDLHTATLEAIARHIRDTLRAEGKLGLMPSVKKQIEAAQSTGLKLTDIEKYIAQKLQLEADVSKLAKTTATAAQALIREIFEDAAVKTLAYDNRVYTEAGLQPINIAQSPTMLRTLEAGIAKQIGGLQRLTGVFTAEASHKMGDLLDNIYRRENAAYMKTTSGTFSYTEAMNDAMDELARDGIKIYHYASGKSISVESAVLRDLRTGITLTAAHITEQGIRERGAKYVETSAHIGARVHKDGGYKSHVEWQGKVFYWKEMDASAKLKTDKELADEGKFANRINELQAIARPGVGNITYETDAKLNDNELNTVNWIHNNIGGDIKVLAESNINGVKNPDLEWNGSHLEIKHTSGNIGTFSKRVQEAMRQTLNGGAAIDISGAGYSNEEAIGAAISRLSGRNDGYVILVRDSKLIGYISK